MRLFIGLEPPQPVRKAITAERKRLHALLGGRPTADYNLHLTLAFVGATDVHTAQRLQALIATIDRPRFAVDLDIAGNFRDGAIVWLGSSTPPAGLEALAGELRSAMDAAGITFDPLPFAPHVTLMRKGAPVTETLAAPIRWPVEHLVLYVSESTPHGVRYRPLYRHALK
ncbi:RNA 2',3'-cyclic phosphodiesterase [Jeongeupia sp. USM3]|uniref:RNA 2',3'-cyclic phosphodiesterase n=1 Tax=Jeongeupia sp. USM3 TaxID=1906741 RepID=UPI00089DF270|nr:RNA 2',3'-cyclic phosphodiesterase [Jeongeupia sp. USM3]AOX99614.1 2'-5' RNA ligase [Jeongeupia sp. USM3]